MSHPRVVVQMMILLMACLYAVPFASAADPTPEEVLKSKGLVKVGQVYIIPDDKAVVELMRATDVAKRKTDVALAKRTAVEDDIKSANKKLENLIAQHDAEVAKLDSMSKDSPTMYNQEVRRANTIRATVLDGIEYVKKKQQALQDLPDIGDEYVAAAQKFTDACDAVAAKYAALAGDDEVTGAIKKINETAKPPVKLGPTDWFTQELPKAQKLKAAVSTATIQFDMLGGVPQVPVTINGTTQTDMVVDSGAAMVTITTEIADKLGIKPVASDETVELLSADGKVTKAHVVTLKSIRLGNFTVENVKCAIQPPEIKVPVNLLGGTFLKHFSYKMDLTAGALKLTQLPETPDPKAAAGTAKMKTP